MQQQHGRCREQREAGGEPQNRRRREGTKAIGVDEEGNTDPVEAGDEVTGSEGPANEKSFATTRRAIEQPEQPAEGRPQQGQNVERR